MANKFIEAAQITPIIEILDLDTDRVGDYLSMANYRKAVFILLTAAGTAGDDWNFTVRQADTAAGGNVKDCDAIDQYWIKQAATNLTGTATFTRSTQTKDALVSGDATSGEEVSMMVCEVDAEDMDTDGGFTFLSCTATLDASGGAQNGTVMCLQLDPRFPQATSLGTLA